MYTTCMETTEMTEDKSRVPVGRPNKPAYWILVAACVVAFVLFNRPVSSNIAWGNDLSAAQDSARTGNTAVFVAFVSRGCVYCTRMEREILTDPKIEQSVNRFVPVRLDLADAPELAARYEVDGVPAYRIIMPDGEVIARTSGYQPVQQFMSFLRYADLALSIDPPSARGDR